MFALKTTTSTGTPLWAYRYRLVGRASRRVQVGGFLTEADAQAALERALEQARRERGLVGPIRFAELAATYLAQHDSEPVTIANCAGCYRRASRRSAIDWNSTERAVDALPDARHAQRLRRARYGLNEAVSTQ